MKRHGLLLLLLLAASCTKQPPERASVAPAPSSPAAVVVDASAPPLLPPPVDPFAAEAKFLLPIPARAQAPESPPSGWCGETAIQEGLLYLGVLAPQRLINKAGRPSHPDLYATDIPVALNEMAVRHTFYSGGRGYDAFAKWAKKTLDEGDPILAGVKILPTEHPEWGLDHFVTIVGYGDKGMLVNTTWGHREWVGDTTTKGLSLKGAFYGIRLQGQRGLPANARAARLSVVDEGDKFTKVRAHCSGLTPGQPYRLEIKSRLSSKSDDFVASAAQMEREHEVNPEAEGTTRFHCVPR